MRVVARWNGLGRRQGGGGDFEESSKVGLEDMLMMLGFEDEICGEMGWLCVYGDAICGSVLEMGNLEGGGQWDDGD